MLEIEQVVKTYGDKGVRAVDDLSFAVEDGQDLRLRDPNGAERRRRLMIAGLLRPDQGDPD